MKNKKLVFSMILLFIVAILIGLLVYGYIIKKTYKVKRPIVSMDIEGYGTVKMELYPEMAPNTVRNFVKLINEGYYNGLTFTRVEENLIQSASKELQEGEKEYSIKGEFSENGFKDNELKFERGTVGLGRADFSDYECSSRVRKREDDAAKPCSSRCSVSKPALQKQERIF